MYALYKLKSTVEYTVFAGIALTLSKVGETRSWLPALTNFDSNFLGLWFW